ncbi:hypothetical protein WUBG_00097 [Wuchereria bancrofti]|uniref:Uncharacterized protein n=1 Tax=Wuchereria bancrofti TaxID=6293 RepID=J9F3A3_WUCBA|nr:hypothetical protein WUBG_00097 [Wuchereria bancrofti]
MPDIYSNLYASGYRSTTSRLKQPPLPPALTDYQHCQPTPGNRSNKEHARSAVPMNRWLYSISCAWYGTMLRDRCATPTPHHKYKDLKGGCIGVRSR